MATVDKKSISPGAKEPFTQLSKLALVMPFQPSMWNDQMMQLAFSNIIDIATVKLKDKFINEHAEQMLVRLRQLFKGLNYNTLYKSVAVLLSAESEKIIHLNFPVKPFMSCSNDISILDLAGSIQHDTGFYMVVIKNEKITLYEYCQNCLNQLYQQHINNASGNTGDLGKKISIVLGYMTNSYQKPLFIIGTQQQLDAMQWASPLPETFFQIAQPAVDNDTDTVQTAIAAIVAKWRHWLSKFHLGNIERARKNDSLIFGIEQVLEALCHHTNGWLLIDRKLKKTIIKNSHFYPHFQDENGFVRQIEKFLSRGNLLRFIESGLLKAWNGIVLLPNQVSGYPDDLYTGNRRIPGALGGLF